MTLGGQQASMDRGAQHLRREVTAQVFQEDGFFEREEVILADRIDPTEIPLFDD